MGPGDLARALCGLELEHHPDVLVGLEHGDDAGVYKLTEDLALIHTVDFFTPIVDDPYLFGEIAAANALSDVYAMGGEPLCAVNIACFPSGTMDLAVLHEILRGGLSKLHEAQALLVGGHTVVDPELKYGLAVTGTVHPARLWAKQGGRPGDQLVLTKALGTGIVSSAIKQGRASAEAVAAAESGMAALNRTAAAILADAEVRACTDITGFGLIGHAAEMIADQPVGLAIDTAAVPLLPDVLSYAQQGLYPGGLKRNREHRAAQVDAAPALSATLVDTLFDPQTSGGLLAAIPAARAARVVEALHAAGVGRATVVGEVVAEPRGRVVLR